MPEWVLLSPRSASNKTPLHQTPTTKKTTRPAWFLAASTCLYGDTETVTSACCAEMADPKNLITVEMPFVALKGIPDICLENNRTITASIESWKQHVADNIFIAKVTYKHQTPSPTTPKRKDIRALSNAANELYAATATAAGEEPFIMTKSTSKEETRITTLEHVEERPFEDSDFENHGSNRVAELIGALLDMKFGQALGIVEEMVAEESMGDPLANAVALHNKAILYLMAGNYKRAIYHFYESLEAKKEIQEGVGQKKQLQQPEKDKQIAAKPYLASSSSSTTSSNSFSSPSLSALDYSKVETMEQMAIALYAFGEYDRARSMYQQIQMMVHAHSLTAKRSWNGLGCCFYALQHDQFAMQCFVRASSTSKTRHFRNGDPSPVITARVALANLGYYRQKLGDDSRAIQCIKEAEQSLQKLLGKRDALVLHVQSLLKSSFPTDRIKTSMSSPREMPLTPSHSKK